MNAGGSIRFLEFPPEIQQLIIWKCLEGWKGTVETHEKPEQKKSTTRIWSSVVKDALMLSLTCRYFHKLIQDIQKDPRLFGGELDMIEANAELSHLVGVFTSNNDRYYIVERDSLPRPLYRTQIFIKASPYDRSDPNWRFTRLKYHAGVRNWLNQNLRSIAVWADEVTSRVPWEMFPNLENVTAYWPNTYFDPPQSNLLLCEHNHADLVSVAKVPNNLHSGWDLGAAIGALPEILKPNLTVTVRYEVLHVHTTREDIELGGYNEQEEKLESAEYCNLDCTFTIRERVWALTSAVCNAIPPMTLDPEDKERFAEFFTSGGSGYE